MSPQKLRKQVRNRGAAVRFWRGHGHGWALRKDDRRDAEQKVSSERHLQCPMPGELQTAAVSLEEVSTTRCPDGDCGPAYDLPR